MDTPLWGFLGRLLDSDVTAGDVGSAGWRSRLPVGHPLKTRQSLPPKLAVSSVVGFIKGKSAISIARNFMGRKRNFTGESF